MTYGAAGIAAALLRIAALRGDPDLLVAADDWAERALRTADAPGAFTEPAIGIDADDHRRRARPTTGSAGCTWSAPWSVTRPAT